MENTTSLKREVSEKGMTENVEVAPLSLAEDRRLVRKIDLW